jgi:guanylate cyclase
MVGLSLFVIPLLLLWAAIYLISGEPVAAIFPLAYVGFSGGGVVFFAITRKFPIYRFGHLLLILLIPFGMHMVLGGFVQGSGAIVFSLLSPLAAMLVADRRQASWWFLAFVGLLAIGVAFELNGQPPNNMPMWLKTIFFAMNLGAMSGIFFLTLRYFNGQKDWAMSMLELERQKSERLLLNVLPPSIAAVLKEGDPIIARHHEETSIMFADIANFTPLSASLEPGEIVEMLNAVFTKFDQLTEHYGLEKIKTIGDSYMVAAGVPEARPDHAEVLAELALEMMDAVRTQAFSGQHLVFRIGINSGPVVAGVIGTRKFSYDLWGDTVNTASRIEQYGVLGEIQIGDATRRKIEHRFHIEGRESIDMKGKGLMQVYLLKGLKDLNT